MKRDAFSLVEMLVATALAAVLMAAVLTIAAGVSRDRRRLEVSESTPSPDVMIERIRWDLTNASAMIPSPDGLNLTLIGHGGIDRQTLRPTGRLARVAYHCRRVGSTHCLVREQAYLDDPANPNPWRDLVACDVASLRLAPLSTDADPVDEELYLRAGGPNRVPLHVPSRAQLQLGTTSGLVIRELVLR
jgi:prepilin-type N-terminal cleavage/methylation domain-containing protein